LVAGGDGREWRVRRVFSHRLWLNEDINLAKEFHYCLFNREAVVRNIVLTYSAYITIPSFCFGGSNWGSISSTEFYVHGHPIFDDVHPQPSTTTESGGRFTWLSIELDLVTS